MSQKDKILATSYIEIYNQQSTVIILEYQKIFLLSSHTPVLFNHFS